MVLVNSRGVIILWLNRRLSMTFFRIHVADTIGALFCLFCFVVDYPLEVFDLLGLTHLVVSLENGGATWVLKSCTQIMSG